MALHDIDVYDASKYKNVGAFTMQERKSFKNWLDRGYVDTFRHFYPATTKFTFWNHLGFKKVKNQGWRIDYMLVNKEHLGIVKDSTIHSEYTGSDHCPIKLEIDIGTRIPKIN